MLFLFRDKAWTGVLGEPLLGIGRMRFEAKERGMENTIDVRRFSLPAWVSLAVLVFSIGIVLLMFQEKYALYLLIAGLSILSYTIVRWFSLVVWGDYSEGVDRSFLTSMIWFIFIVFILFWVFFLILLYVRFWVLPLLSGFVKTQAMTQDLLLPVFKESWPMLPVPDPSKIRVPGVVMLSEGIPVISTSVLLCSGLSATISHHALIHKKNRQSFFWLLVTVSLGCVFLGLQSMMYFCNYQGFIQSGVYGNVFFLMASFHGLHVLIASAVLMVILMRMGKGVFTRSAVFAFEAAVWYWHFLDLVWLLLFVFVYWI